MVTIDGSIVAAKAMRRRLMAEGRPVAGPGSAASPSTLAEFSTAYFRAKSAVLSPHTIDGAETDYRLRIASQLGHVELTQITRERIEVWLADLIATASSRRMVVATLATLRAMLGTAVEWGRIASNPALRLHLPAPETHAEQAVERVLDEAALARLLSACARPRTATMIRAAAEGGLRRGEIIGLRWPDVNLSEGRLDVRRSVWQVGGERGERSTKGRRARRVAISTTFAAALADWFAVSVVEGGAAADGYVWPGRGGGAMNAHSPSQLVARVLVRAGLVANPKRGKDEPPVPLVTLHGLRHTCGSILLANGVPLIVVSRHLGHANPNITAKVYAHLLSDSELDRVADVFEPSSDAGTVRETVREEQALPETPSN